MKPPTLLLIDAETSGLYKSHLALDDPSQPWIVSCAAALCTNEGEFIQHFDLVIKAEGRVIQTGAERVHGITAREASQLGVPEARFLGLVSDLLKTMPVDSYIKVISYGSFDRLVLASLFARFAISQGKPANAFDRLWYRRPLVEFINLMDPWCTNACKIPSDKVEGSLKWPSLDESRQIILGKPPREGAHNAWEDMLDLRDIYLALRTQGFFDEGAAA